MSFDINTKPIRLHLTLLVLDLYYYIIVYVFLEFKLKGFELSILVLDLKVQVLGLVHTMFTV